MAVAFCWRNGSIGIDRRLSKNAIKLGEAHGIRLQNAVSVCVRPSRDGLALLVPGIPEANNDTEASQAVQCFREQLSRRLARKKRGWELI